MHEVTKFRFTTTMRRKLNITKILLSITQNIRFEYEYSNLIPIYTFNINEFQC